MTRKLLTELLTEQLKAGVDGDNLTVPADCDVTIYVSLGGDPLIVERVSALKANADALIIATRRKESYFLAYEDVRAVRVAHSGKGGAGY